MSDHPAAGSAGSASAPPPEGLPPLEAVDVPDHSAAPLHPLLEPLAAYVGTWRGIGQAEYPTHAPTWYGQEVLLEHDGRPFLAYRSRSWALDDGRPLAAESGFWRVPPDPSASDAPLEVLLAHSVGVCEVYVGRWSDQGVELVSDITARTATAREVNASSRLYGVVDDALFVVVEMAAVGQPLQPHLSARLLRVG